MAHDGDHRRTRHALARDLLDLLLPMTWLMVAMTPIFIMIMMTSAALTDIFCASSETEMFSGISTSWTTGAVGRSKPCSPVRVMVTRRCCFGFFLRRPLLSAATCSSRRP
jgi:hypothetical protein